MLSFGLTTPAFANSVAPTQPVSAVALPPGVVDNCSNKETFFWVEYNDSDSVGIDQGCSKKKDVKQKNDSSLIADKLKLSCKVKKDSTPEIVRKSKLGASDREIVAFHIATPKETCGAGYPGAPTVTPPTTPGDGNLPPGVTNTCTGKETFFIFKYNDSGTVGVDQGCVTKNEATRDTVPGLIANNLHVSCSDKIDSTGLPTKSDLGHPDRRITDYFISKDGGKKTCGEGYPGGPPTVDLEIEKDASDYTVVAGDEVTYTLTANNIGGTTATQVVVSDPLPAEVEFVSASPGCTYDASTRTVSCVIGTMPAGGETFENTCSDKETYYKFEYNDSGTVGIDEGCSDDKDVKRSNVPGLIANNLHVSCSDKIDASGLPSKSDLGDPNRRISAFHIEKDGGKKSCGEGTFTPVEPVSFDITVVVNESHCNEATIDSEEPDSDPSDNTDEVCVDVISPQLTVSKTVDPESTTVVLNGSTLSYTLTFSNAAGTSAAVVDYTDDMTQTLDDATLTTAPVVASGSGLTVSGVMDGEFTITGSLSAGETTTVTYQVTATGAGDANIDNYLVPTGTTPPDLCLADNPLCTTNPIAVLFR